MPDTSMASLASTVIAFLLPDTCTLAQWPVIVTWLVMPLMRMTLLLQAIVLTWSIPEISRLAPAGAVGAAVGPGVGGADGTALGTGVTPAEGATAVGAKVGLGSNVVIPLCDTVRAVKNKIPAGRATIPTTKSAAKIHHTRAREPVPNDDVLRNDPL
jgi:hypothetical protein